MAEMMLTVDAEPHPDIPFLFEVWNWVGDISILPHKWHEILKKCGDEFSEISKQELAELSKSTQFNPNQFFFLTTRSEATACAVLLPRAAPGEMEIGFLAVVPQHRNTPAVCEAIIAL
jgi:hypothetical protein